MQRNNDYKLIDLIKFLCAYLVIEIHTGPLQAVSVLLDKVVYYDISIMQYRSFMHVLDIS